MANQDFDINIRVNANTAQVDAIRNSFEKLGAQVKVTNAEMAAGSAGGLGSAAGVGTIISALTMAVSKWKEFEDEQDKITEKMMVATEKSHELGLAVADMLDAMKSAERIKTEPLQVSFDRLTQKVRELKTEMQLAFEAGEYEDVKKYAAALGVVESQLDRVTSSLEKQNAAKEKQRNKESSERREFEVSAYEAEAREADVAGDSPRAQRARQTAEALKRGISREEIAGQQEGIVGRRAGVGESQDLVNKIERNRIGNEAALKADPELLIRIDKLIEQWQ
jgi:hypothetical protein